MQAFDPIEAPDAAIVGESVRFPIRRVYCVGRNFAAHAREMLGDEREPPFFFTKFANVVIPSGGTLPYPPATAELHHEGELVLAIGAVADRVRAEAALGHVFGYACGLDMTRRDLQAVARAAGKPWDMAKNFSGAAVLAPILPAAQAGDMTTGAIRLDVNGAVRQSGDLADMIWSAAEIVAKLSEFDRLAPGDLIFTGTPAGVGAVVPGDRITLRIDRLPPLDVTIGETRAAPGA